MELKDLILAVREQNLTKTELEGYCDQLAGLLAQMEMEMADLEKEEALFMNGKADGQSVADRKVSWKATQSGQRLIVLKRYARATNTMVNSVKRRLYVFL